MIQIGTLIVTPDNHYAKVFANYGSSVGVELVPSHRLVWVEESAVKPGEPPSEEEVAYG